MKLPQVFIASSSEAREIAKVLRGLLLEELRDKADLTPWTRAFDLGATNIESLEKAAEEADFAVLVVTPDDLTISREEKKAAPRDNIIFELGLFMGALGRKRCLIVSEETPGLKIPTDLQGVTFATFKRSPDRDLQNALDGPSLAITERIETLRAKYKLRRDLLQSHMAIQDFCERVKGDWWERIMRDDASAISFFQIEYDPLFSSVLLSGKSYDRDGRHIGNWKSVLGRVEKDDNTILYYWKGWHATAALANIHFHGFGDIEFDKPLRSGETISRGSGRFWNVDETHPERTIIKPIQIRRILDAGALETIAAGNEKAIGSLIQKTLSEW
jgi:Predicted nucleotide-binding protein containing TIR-like domain